MLRKHGIRPKGKKPMARKTRTRTIVRTVTARSPSPTIRVVAPSNPGRPRFHRIRRAASAVGGAAATEKHMLVAFAAAGAYGLAERAGMPIPTIGPIGPAGTLAVAAWLYGKTQKNKTALHLATGLGCIAINRLAATGTVVGGGTAAYED